MKIKDWNELPPEMQTDEVRTYYNYLQTKKVSLFFKRMFDIVVSSLMLIVLFPIFIAISVAIKLDSKGPVFFRQERVTQYNRVFKIFKFRSMVQNSESGSGITISNDTRITRIGKFIRKYRLDELSQLIDVFRGTMTFVGTRPESVKYVKQYTPEMMATLLLPAGVTSLASIYFKDEAELLESTNDVDKKYVEDILPIKMHYNLKGIQEFSFWGDIKIMFMTVFAVLGKNYKDGYIEEKKMLWK